MIEIRPCNVYAIAAALYSLSHTIAHFRWNRDLPSPPHCTVSPQEIPGHAQPHRFSSYAHGKIRKTKKQIEIPVQGPIQWYLFTG